MQSSGITGTTYTTMLGARCSFFVLLVCCFSVLEAQPTEVLLKQASDLNFKGYYEDAVKLLRGFSKEEAIDAKASLLANLYYELGEGYLNVGKCDSARLAIQKGIDLGKANDTLIADGYYIMAKAVGGCANSWNEAMVTLRKSSEIRKHLFGEESLEVSADYTLMGYLLLFNGSYDSAFFFLEKALEVRTQDTEEVMPMDLAVTYYYLGKVHERKGNLKQSLDFLRRSLKIREEQLQPLHPSISNCLNDIGNVFKRYGNYQRALDYYQRSLEIRKQSLGADHVNVGASYYSIGTLYGNMFDYKRAIPFIYQGNQVISRKFGEESPVLHTYYAYLGRLYHKTGDGELARLHFDKAKNLAEQYLNDRHPYLAIVYNILGQYYADKEDQVEQEKYHSKALKIYQEVSPGSISHAEVLTSLAALFGKQGDLTKAHDSFQEAKEIYEGRLGLKNPKLGTLYKLWGDIDFLSGGIESAAEKYWKSLSAVSNINLDGEKPIETDAFTDRVIALRSIHKLAIASREMYESTLERVHLEKALSFCISAVELIDLISLDYQQEDSKAQLAKDTKLVLDDAVEIAFQMTRVTGNIESTEQLHSFIEKSKSAILLSQLQARDAQRYALIPDSVIGIERDLRIELTYNRKQLQSAEGADDSVATFRYRNEVFKLESSYNQFKEMLKKRFPDYYTKRYANKVFSLAEVQNRMPEGTMILNYYESMKEIFVLAIGKEESRASRCKLSSHLQAAILGYKRSLTDNAFIVEHSKKADSLYISTASLLYDSLVSPSITGADIKKLTIIPDGRLAALSFGTFLMNRPVGDSFRYRNLSYLLSKYVLSYAHSATVGLKEKRYDPAKGFAGFAPSYDFSSYATVDSSMHPMTYELVRNGTLPLPGAIAEVKQINKLFRGDVWLNERASESNFKSHVGDYSVIHLAMHSLLNTQDPVFSELLFNSKEDSLNDGFLTIDEIYNLDLNAEMAVLSACSSGGGKIEVGEGPISFSRAFEYAGCPSVITSLWKLPDEATRTIMVFFYENLNNGLSKDEALQFAQQHYLENTADPLYQHPFFWGSVVVLGDTRAIKVSNSYLYRVLFVSFSAFLIFLLIRRQVLVRQKQK